MASVISLTQAASEPRKPKVDVLVVVGTRPEARAALRQLWIGTTPIASRSSSHRPMWRASGPSAELRVAA